MTFMPDQIDGPQMLAQSDPPAFHWLEIAVQADALALDPKELDGDRHP